MESGVLPVFLKARDIPNSLNRATVLEMCVAGERAAGSGSVVGAQLIKGLWRIYTATTEARNQLLVKGMSVRGTVLQVLHTNPYILRSESGQEKPTTKVWVDDLPISVADSEIEHSLVSIGCELRSAIKLERARDVDNKLTRFLTGRRFVFITMPDTPLEKELKISVFNTKIYHKEQKQVPKKKVFCSKCLQPNHHVSVCTNEVVCLACKQPGHKRGDTECELVVADTASDGESGDAEDEPREQRDNNHDEQQGQHAGGDHGQPAGEAERRPASRGRTGERQATLTASLQLRSPTRSRSETPKRRRSTESAGSKETTGKGKRTKQVKQSGGQSKTPPLSRTEKEPSG